MIIARRIILHLSRWDILGSKWTVSYWSWYVEQGKMQPSCQANVLPFLETKIYIFIYLGHTHKWLWANVSLINNKRESKRGIGRGRTCWTFQSCNMQWSYPPSLRFSLAKPGPWLLDSCEELLKDDGSRPDTSGLWHISGNHMTNTNY